MFGYFPLFLTSIRFFGALLFPLLMLAGIDSFVLAFCYIGLALTDWLDGLSARIVGGETIIGRLLDPFADKLLVIGPLIILVKQGLVGWHILYSVIFRELLVTVLREYSADLKMPLLVQPIGKIKTIIQMGYVGLAIALGSDYFFIKDFADPILMLITVSSAIVYVRVALFR